MNNKLYVRQDIGTGHPIVLLHGIFADGTQWTKITNLLKSEYRVIVLDILGHGKSPRPENAKYTPDEHVDALRNTLIDLGATTNLTLVGYSMGGAVALSYCHKYKQGVEQLYLLSTPFYLEPDQMIATNYAGSVLLTKSSQSLYRFIEHHMSVGKTLNKLVYLFDKSKLFHKMIGAYDNKLDGTIIKYNIKNMIREFDFAGKLSEIDTPTTIYAGKKDPFIVQGQLYALKKFKPSLEISRLDIIKVDHMIIQNLPKSIAKLVTKHKQRTLHVGFDEGSGTPLILLHGIESSSSYWRYLIKPLSRNKRVIAIDLLGFGKSPMPHNILYSLDDHVEWLKRSLDDLKLDTFEIAGHSLGGLVALAYAAKYPNKVSKLTLFSPVFLPNEGNAKKLTVKSMQKFHYIPDTSFLYSQAAETLGDEKLSKYLPSARTIENAINNQNINDISKKASNVPISIYFGGYDPLVDGTIISNVSKNFKNAKVVELPKKYHNFALFSPTTALNALDPGNDYKFKANPKTILPPTFIKQISRLAIPTLMAKSVVYIIIGLSLFSNLAPAALTIILTIYVLVVGYKTIKGSFTLKNEGLSYLGYLMLGAIVVLIGYALFNNPQLSIRLSVIIICILFVIIGLSRLLVAFKWTTSNLFRRSLLFSGTFMTVTGLAAFAGSIVSIYIIIYTIAAILIYQGIKYGWYTIGALAMAYVRGFNK